MPFLKTIVLMTDYLFISWGSLNRSLYFKCTGVVFRTPSYALCRILLLNTQQQVAYICTQTTVYAWFWWLQVGHIIVHLNLEVHLHFCILTSLKAATTARH